MQIDPRHFRLLADRITQPGYLVPLTRNGLDRVAESPWMRATFEKNPENLAIGAAWGVDDPMAGPSERIVLGRDINHGTGTVEIRTDMSKSIFLLTGLELFRIPLAKKQRVQEDVPVPGVPVEIDTHEDDDGFVTTTAMEAVSEPAAHEKPKVSSGFCFDNHDAADPDRPVRSLDPDASLGGLGRGVLSGARQRPEPVLGRAAVNGLY